MSEPITISVTVRIPAAASSHLGTTTETQLAWLHAQGLWLTECPLLRVRIDPISGGVVYDGEFVVPHPKP